MPTIKDASTNEILAYYVSDRITLDIATETIKKLMKNKKVNIHDEAFIHSDQGSHYTSPRYQKLLHELKSKINHYMVYYNNYRYQWNLKKMTPIQYRNHLLVA